MRNPLTKRVPRELLGDWHKYLVILLFTVLMIGAASGVYVANDSMEQSIADAKTNCLLEDGRFELDRRADDELISDIESGKRADVRQHYLDKAYEEADKVVEEIGAEMPAEMLGEAKSTARAEAEKAVDEEYGKAEKKYGLDKKDFTARPVTVYENFYKETSEGADGKTTVRVYQTRDDIDLADIHEGRFPEAENEIAVDRMHADNVGIKVGDMLNIGGEEYKVTGLIACVNYSTLFAKNTDMMFDAITFDVAMVTPEAFDTINARLHYNYAWKYRDAPDGDKENAEYSDDFMLSLISSCAVNDCELRDYVPVYLNQAVNFAPDDMGSDKVMMGILVYILMAVIAFIFAITTSTTITKESSVVGTLRASGYTKGELLRHYITMPIIVTLLGAVIGNILGYTLFKDVVVKMYYNSYSLMTYRTILNADAFVRTTVVPLILMIVINLVIIGRMLKLSPLRFLRHDLSRTKRSKARRLPRWSFLRRFRLRILGQNLANYGILLAGIIFIELMLSMAVGFPDSLRHYQNIAGDMLISEYQTMLSTSVDEDDNVISTDTEGAEKFASESLVYDNGRHDEAVTIYGLIPDSKYVSLPALNDGEVTVSSAFSGKYRLGKGDEVTLDEKYTYGKHTFKVKAVTDYDGGVAVFMPIDRLNAEFDREPDSFSGFFSNEKITDIDEKYIVTEITKKDITKMTDQLDHSMGNYMLYFQYVCIALAAVLIYLLTKIIIEKNENAISMTKVLGFTNREVDSLYIHTTTVLVLLFTLIGEAIGVLGMGIAFREFLMTTDGWFKFYVSPVGLVKIYAFAVIGYLIVTFLDSRRIKRIPLDTALKNVE